MSDTITVSPVSTVEKTQVMEGVSTWRNPINGFAVIDLKYYADPRKRSDEWLLTAKSGIPTAEFEREYGDKWIVYEGKPVYGNDFIDLPTGNVVTGSIIATKRARLVSGWDAGPTDLNLAWVLGLVQPQERRVTFIDEYYQDDGDVEDFVQIVSSRLQLEWLKLGGFSLHFCDQSVNTAGGPKKKSFADEMRLHNMIPQMGEISFARRRVSVFNLLTHNKGGRPLLLIHERCSLLIEAMKGGYQYPKLPMISAGGMYKEMPLKNKFSHIANALEYVCSRIDAASSEIPYEGKRLPRYSLV
mgnify:CR=1 FL=1